MGNYTIFQMFENPRRGRKARNFTTNVPKILDLKSSPNRYFPKIDVGCPCKMLTTRKNYKLQHGYKKQTLSDEFLRRMFRRYRKFLSLIRYAMHDFHFPHLCSHSLVYNAKLTFQMSMFVARLLKLSPAWKFPLHVQF